MLISLTDYRTRQQILLNPDEIVSVQRRENFSSIKIKDNIHPIEVEEEPSEILNRVRRSTYLGIKDA
ncbi:MAG: hypothetical protein WC679_12795 [Bacteroidales bacterium]|jgi:hypothetical protein